MIPAITSANKKYSKPPNCAIPAMTSAIIPAAGPLTLKDDSLIKPTTIPPMIPARMPEKSGTPHASAIPKHKGIATNVTTTLAKKSFLRVLMFIFYKSYAMTYDTHCRLFYFQEKLFEQKIISFNVLSQNRRETVLMKNV